MPKWLRWLLYACMAAYLAYLLAGNLLLNTALGESLLNRKPERFQMHWSRGATWWPGHVALRDLRLQGQVRRTLWHAEAASARGRIALLPLLRRELRVPVVVADGVDGGARRVQRDLPPALPPSPGPSSASAAPSRAGGWTLRFERIASASVRSGEYGEFALAGLGSVDAGFVKQLRGGPMQLLPTRLDFAHARISRGGQVLLPDAALHAQVAIDRHRGSEAPGLRKLLKTEAALKLDGATGGLDIRFSADGKPQIASAPGEGRLHVDLGYVRGALKPGSRVEWRMPLAGHDIAGATRHEAIEFALAAERDIAVRAKVPPQADGRLSIDADLRLQGTQLPLEGFASLLPRASGHVQGRWRFGSLAWLGGLFPQAPWLKLDGAGDVDADVQVAAGKLAAGSRIGVPVDAVVEVMGNRIRGSARADVRLDADANGELLPRLDATMEQFHIAAIDTPQRPYVQGRNLRLQLNADNDLARLRDSLRGRVTFRDATVPDLRAYNRYLPQSSLRFEGGAGTVSGDMSLDARGDIAQGQLRIAGRAARLAMAQLALRSDVDIAVQLKRGDLAQRRFVIDGSTVDLSNASFSEPGGEARSGWWARIRLPAARMDLETPFQVDGRAEVTMKDVGFLLALFSQQKDYPAWALRLVDAGQAQVAGRVQWNGDTLVLDGISARNDRFDLLARLRLRGERREGSLYAHWGLLSAALELQPGQPRPRLHLRGAREWYDAQPSLLR